MMWEEKIDLLKKEFLPQEFHVPFTDGSDILKKIEGKFVVKQNRMYIQTNWAQKLKSIRLVQSVDKRILPNVLNRLNENQTYWFVVVMGDAPTSKQYVYSCSPKATQSLASMTANDFFVVDKKLAWLTYFHQIESRVEIFKSGEAKTPFDKTDLK